MAERVISDDFTRHSHKLSVPSIFPTNVSGENLLNLVSSQFKKIGEESFKEWQEAELNKAKTEGQIEGNAENVTYKKGGNLSSKVFNEAAKKTYALNLELNSKLKMRDLKEQNINDPAKYEKESNTYIENIISDLNSQKETKNLVPLFKSQMQLTQQNDSYQIAKIYKNNLISQMKANTETLYQNIKTDSYKTAGGIFSKDDKERNIAFNTFALNKQLLNSSLQMVTPDGTPVYSAEAIQKRNNQFHNDFYIQGVQNWVSETEISTQDLINIKNKDLKVPIPGTDKHINIIDEIGSENYQKKVLTFTENKLRDKEALNKKTEAQEEEIAKHNRNVADVKLISDIFDGNPVSSNEVINNLKNNTINKTAALSAIKMLQNPEIVNRDDRDLIAFLNVRQILGEDISKDIIQNASRMTPETYRTLLANNAKALAAKITSLQKEHQERITLEIVQRDRNGYIKNPETMRLAHDTVDQYRQNIKDGMTEELAYSKARETIDIINEIKNKRLLTSIPKYLVANPDNTINFEATLNATTQAAKEGKITEQAYKDETDRLEILIAAQQGKK